MNNDLRILVIEDGLSDFLFLKKHLENLDSWKIEVVKAESFDDARSILVSISIDLCIIDYSVANETADKFLIEIQYFREYVPIVLSSGRDFYELHEIALRFEVDNFICKANINKELLTLVVKNSIAANTKRIEARTIEQKYNNFIHNSLEAIFTADKNYRILFSNESFKRLIKLEDDTGFDFRTLFVEDNYLNFFTAISPQSNRKIQRTTLLNCEGESLDVYIAITRIYSDTEESHFQGVIHDITELQKIQNKLNESEKIHLIQRMARIIGHEVRNPLTNILLATEELKHDFLESEDASILLTMIHRNSGRISSLIDNFLNNAANAELNMEMVVLESVIQRSYEECKDRILLKQINCELKGMNGETLIEVDPEKIKIVFTNIIINATEALEHEENAMLEIQLSIENAEVLVSISDNGIGMTDEVIKNLFSPFYSNKQGGLGLGMANVKNILDQHDASINVSSEIGKGTRFLIVF